MSVSPASNVALRSAIFFSSSVSCSTDLPRLSAYFSLACATLMVSPRLSRIMGLPRLMPSAKLSNMCAESPNAGLSFDAARAICMSSSSEPSSAGDSVSDAPASSAIALDISVMSSIVPPEASRRSAKLKPICLKDSVVWMTIAPSLERSKACLATAAKVRAAPTAMSMPLLRSVSDRLAFCIGASDALMAVLSSIYCLVRSSARTRSCALVSSSVSFSSLSCVSASCS